MERGGACCPDKVKEGYSISSEIFQGGTWKLNRVNWVEVTYVAFSRSRSPETPSGNIKCA
jgi:hypothetical protein